MQLRLPESLRAFLLAVTGNLLDNPDTSTVAHLANYRLQLQHATKAELCSKRFWERCVEQALLPALLSAAAAAEAAWKAQDSSRSQDYVEQQQGQHKEQILVDRFLRQAESAGGIQLSAPHKGPFVNMGQSANKLALTVYQLITASPSGSSCWQMCWGVVPSMQPAVHAAHQAMAMAFQHDEVTSAHM